MRQRLKLYTGEQESKTVVADQGVTVTLGEIAQVLADAVRANRAWVRDFEDDQIKISSDLYEVLSTYWSLRTGA